MRLFRIWLVAIGTLAATGQVLSVPDPLPRDAVQAILDTFERFPIVAIGENHRNQQIHDFIVDLISSPGFPDHVNDIVVEFGAARYQGLVNRYIAGEAIPLDQLRWAWRDTVNILVWDSPVYQRFFETVRAVNQRLPQRKRLRVRLGDPVFDWRRVENKEQWERLASQRDPHASAVVENEVLRKRRRALLIFGTSHVMRESAYDPLDSTLQGKLNLTETLEKNHPGIVFAIWPHTDNWGEISGVDPRLTSWPKPSLALLNGTWLGSIAVGEPGTPPRMHELADAFLYLGPGTSQTLSVPPDAIYADPLYMRELVRRDRIQGGYNTRELDRLMRSAGFSQ